MALPEKRPIRDDLVRKIPGQFSWLDRKLIRNRLIEGLSTDAIALYLVLVCVSDRLGLSFYGDRKLCGMLSIDAERLQHARYSLTEHALIAYRYPLYQVLELPDSGQGATVPPAGSNKRKGNGPQLLGEILKTALRETSS